MLLIAALAVVYGPSLVAATCLAAAAFTADAGTRPPKPPPPPPPIAF
jgi:hypothetical protein